MPICELRFRSVSRIGMPAHRSSYEGFSGWLGWWEPLRAPVLERYLLSAFQQQCYNLLWLFSQGLELQGGLGSLTELCWESWEWLHHSCYNPENIMCFTFWKKAFIRVRKHTEKPSTKHSRHTEKPSTKQGDLGCGGLAPFWELRFKKCLWKIFFP